MTDRLPAGLLLAALAWCPQQLIDQHGQILACATSPATCQEAITAIEAGRWARELRGRQLRCEPAQCFSHRAQCIPNFNCPSGGR